MYTSKRFKIYQLQILWNPTFFIIIKIIAKTWYELKSLNMMRNFNIWKNQIGVYLISNEN